MYHVPFTYLNFTYAFKFNGGLWWCVGGLDPCRIKCTCMGIENNVDMIVHELNYQQVYTNYAFVIYSN